jgi:hypothetical protein
VYAFVIDGIVSVNDVALERRDSLSVWGGEPITVNTDTEDADVLFVEMAPEDILLNERSGKVSLRVWSMIVGVDSWQMTRHGLAPRITLHAELIGVVEQAVHVVGCEVLFVRIVEIRPDIG